MGRVRTAANSPHRQLLGLGHRQGRRRRSGVLDLWGISCPGLFGQFILVVVTDNPVGEPQQHHDAHEVEPVPLVHRQHATDDQRADECGLPEQAGDAASAPRFHEERTEDRQGDDHAAEREIGHVRGALCDEAGRCHEGAEPQPVPEELAMLHTAFAVV